MMSGEDYFSKYDCEVWEFFSKWGFDAEYDGIPQYVAAFFMSPELKKMEQKINQDLMEESFYQAEREVRVGFYEVSSSGNPYRAQVSWKAYPGEQDCRWDIDLFHRNGAILPEWVEAIIEEAGEEFFP